MPIGKTFNVGVLGGNFDPAHWGHLLIAQEARLQCDLERVLLIPYRTSPREEDRDVTSPQERLLMVELAIKEVPYLQVNTMELNREGPSYTVETLRELKDRHDDWNLHFIIGSDNLKEFHTWKKPDEILDLAKLFVARRDENPKKVPSGTKEIIREKGMERLVFQEEDSPQFYVSSSLIRRRFKENKPIKFLMPDEVAEYVEENDLYRERQSL